MYTLLLLASLLCGCLCVVWGPKESLSGVRGHGQRTPQVFEISPAGELIEDELQSIASHFTANNPSGLKRQVTRGTQYKKLIMGWLHVNVDL